VIGMSLALVFCVAAFVVHRLGVGSPKPLLVLAAVVQGVGVFVSFRFKPDKGAVTSDERDRLITKNANLAGFGGAYLFIIIASFAPIAILGEKASVPVTWLPGLLVGASLCHGYAFFLAILVQYGRGGKDE
jgi:hypothetical protein